MSEFDYEAFDADGNNMSTMGAAISNAIEAKNSLNAAMGAAIDSASEFGYELGRLDQKAEIVAIFDRAIKAMDEKQVVEMQTALTLLSMINAPTEEAEDGEEGRV